MPVDEPMEGAMPGPVLHVWGNVREWCEDGPPDKPYSKFAAGGSFKAVPQQGEVDGVDSHRPDLGLRLWW